MELHVRRFGDPDAPTLVLVHGLTEDGGCWPEAVARWQDRWHIVAVDQRGHGDSPGFSDEQLRRAPQTFQVDLEAVLAEVGPAILVAHSLGGLVAARVAHDHPGLVIGAVLEDPAKPTGDWAVDPGFSGDILRFVETVTADPDGELARMRRETSWSEAELRDWAASKAKVDRRFVREGTYLGDSAWEDLFQGITVPTLVVVPAGGEMAPDGEQVSNPLVRIHELPGVGHCVRRDDPDAYHRVVDPFLDELRSEAPRGAFVP